MERSSVAPERPCPALDPSARWDEPDALRGEIQVADQLVLHAAELARSHGPPSHTVASGRLWQRFLAVKSQIHDAYAVLTARLKDGKDPSPAEEWLVDNSHVVEDQIREIEEDLPRGYLLELPRLTLGKMRGYPRVYALCLDYLRHTDARVDLSTLSGFVESYQSVEPLTIGELWAVPIMLRLGLLLTVGALAASEASSGNRERADAWSERLLAARHNALELGAELIVLEKSGGPITAPFLVQLARRLREHDDAALAVAFDWLGVQSQKLGATPEELARVQHLRQAADQVSVGNAVTSMRAVAALAWNVFFERTSGVEAVLRNDPHGTYVATDPETRDRYRHAVERLARRGEGGEIGVARLALALAEQARDQNPDDRRRAHVGYYLVDAGRALLEPLVRYRPSLGERVRRALVGWPKFFYFGGIGAVTLACVAFVLAEVAASDSYPRFGAALLAVAACVALIPASEVALALAQAIVTAVLRPRLLPRLAFEHGVPAGCRTLVVVPCLFDSKETIALLLEELEVRSLANGDKHLHFALLGDFTDAACEELERDAELLRAAEDGIAALNARNADGEHRYWLFVRRRRFNPSEGRYMGWERKRGKLEELNRLLRGATDTSFAWVVAPTAMFAAIRYVITLDADTDLPRETASELIATLAHPLNAAEFDAARQRVVRGYGIAQPRVGPLPLSSRRSRYAALTAGPAGIDPYTTAVSDVYQDLFGEGSYTGKAIYDVDAFSAALAGRAPENALLSHDLFESFFARSALVTDVEVLDEQPASYEVHAARQHRWMRGDWQLVRWLLPRVPTAHGRRPNDLRLLDRFKLVDNLRRSLLPPTLVVLALGGVLAGGRVGLAAGVLFAAVLVTPLLAQVVLAITREASRVSGAPWAGFGGAVGRGALKIAFDLVFLLDQALLAVDAISVALVRLVTQKHLLEWVTMRQSAARRRTSLRLLVGSVLAVLGAVALGGFTPRALPLGLPLLAAWALAPLASRYLDGPLPAGVASELETADDKQVLRLVARKTWRFFAHFVNAKENHLPPDNYQKEPRGVVAHRTSPTNIGLYLLSVLAAHDFGVLTLREVCERIELTLDTLDRLPRRDGHLLNWYETDTLKPLLPQYVSTVDSGNLAAYLWTIASATNELQKKPILGVEPFIAVADALELARRASAEGTSGVAGRLGPLERKVRALAEPRSGGLLAALDALESVATLVAELARTAASDPAEMRYWLGEAERTARAWAQEITALLPHLALFRATAPVVDGSGAALWQRLREELTEDAGLEALERAARNAHELADEMADGAARSPAPLVAELEGALDRSASACRARMTALERVAARCRSLADGMSFGFLYDHERELFATGYNVSNARLDTSHYDLLASEARLASLVAVAKGDAPQKHWFRLGRPRARVDSRVSLLSWSGSMFEYLMPLLVTECLPETLLDETMQAAVRGQRAYGAEHGVPWGVSESAYNVMDLEMTYQYRAFGVPGLGLKAGLAEDLVVAPYATALAALVDPVAAVKNLKALAREGLEGDFGFFEAIDYSATRVPPGKRGVVVRSFMAHHLGMTLVALDNVLHERCMQRRFHADARVKASALLLEERIPTGAPLTEVASAALAAPVRHAVDLDAMEHVRIEDMAPARVHLLGHGQLSTLVTATGAGALTWKGMDVNRFREDSVFDPGGIYAYVRDLGGTKAWSAGFHPSRRQPDAYEAAFSIDRVELHRRDGSLETITEVVPSAEHPAEVRRYTLKNHGAEPCDVELTTFTELALAPRGADMAHRAFSSMFVETEFLPDHGALLAHRRPRGPNEPAIWVAQVLTPEDEGFGEVDFDSSRASFIGRAGSLERPAVFGQETSSLARRTGSVLDPAFVLRRRIRLAASAAARVTLTTIIADTREELLHWVAIYAAAQAIPRAFELAWADARVELRHLGMTAVQAHRFQRLLSAIVFPLAALRAQVDPAALGTRGKNALWSCGISGDLPVVVLRLDHPEFDDLLRELLQAHAYYRVNGVALDLLVLNEEPAGYLQPLYDQALDVVRSTHSEGLIDQRGGIFVRRSDQIGEADRALLLASARAVFTASGGSLSRQLKHATRRSPLPEPLVLTDRPVPRPSLPPVPRSELVFDNGLGGFTPDGREYVMTLDRHARTPQPWCNVVANPRFGSVVSESGASFTWAENSQRHRLTPWSNDALLDPPGAPVYVRDDEDGSVWSPAPRPAGGSAVYTVAHGQGYSRFTHTRSQLFHELTVFVAADAPVAFQRVRIENRGTTPRRLSVFGVVEWVLGGNRETSRLTVATGWDAAARALTAQNPFAITPLGVAFFAATVPIASFTANREEFFGMPGSRTWPHALRRSALSGQYGVGLDPCAALQTSVTLAPGEAFEVSFVLGQAANREEMQALATAYADEAAVGRALEAVKSRWDELLSAVTIKTPDASLDLLVNRWVLYQALACRIWARSGFYQSSGAFGFRDQLQDVLCLLHTLPSAAREHLLVAAARQFVEGDVQHWWHREAGDGVRTRCSDDKLWLPFAVAEYVRVTEDRAVLDEAVPFLNERLLAPEEHDLYSTPASSDETATLYEHCARALESSLAVGVHGLPKMGAGDWNDGMDRIGAKGEGESVWLAWFLAKTLRDFAPLAQARKDARATRWVEHARRLVEAAETHAWDGAWYRRAFFDDGTPVGTASAAECRIDAIAQSWSVFAGADRRRASGAVLESERLLVDPDARIMRLLTPPFHGAGPDPGYIASYPAGIRENGGQYTHGVLFTLRALTELGEAERAERLLAVLNPIRHAENAADVARYQVEPYVVAADVYSNPEHDGRGGWTWYTGSAGWFYRIVLEDVLGFRRSGRRVTIAPCIPASWPGFELTYRFGRSTLKVVVENARGAQNVTDALRFDGRPQSEPAITLTDDGRAHELRVIVGERRLRSSA
ncbi:MAG TPA: glucoamylase family protein [Polyangiaceae bacterium]|nr:glucoamylase family protein [Polyangiaceae bacterium]